MKYCSECGSKLKDDQKFCDNCGNKIIKNDGYESDNNSIKYTCKYCKKEIEKNTKICPYCNKRLKKSFVPLIILFIIIFGVFSALISIYDTSELKVTDNLWKCSELGVYEWKGKISNNGSKDVDNVNLTLTCYNSSRENKGMATTSIKYIKSGETLDFNASGIGTCEAGLKCEYKIERNTSDGKVIIIK